MSALTMECTEAVRPEPLLRSGGRRTMAHALVLTHRHLLHVVRVPGLALWSTVQPILFLLLFNFMFGGVISRDTGDYINFVVPGIVVQFLALIVFETALGVHADISTGIVDRFRSLPIARSAVLSGRIFSDAIRSAVNVVSIVTVGALLGFRFSTGVMPAVGAFLLAIGFGVALSWVGAWIGLRVRSLEMVQSVGTIWVVPLTFLSSLFVPTQTVPGWLQAVVRANPLTNVADALRALTLGGPTTGPVLASLAWTIGILVTFSALAVRQYRRIE
ncbi:MAG: ABC transporter permease [Pseudonocardiales bacterium]|nr:ABC transporter permease [Pseudonocardiales bacterium]